MTKLELWLEKAKYDYDYHYQAIAVIEKLKEALEFYARANAHPMILEVAPRFRRMHSPSTRRSYEETQKNAAPDKNDRGSRKTDTEKS